MTHAATVHHDRRDVFVECRSTGLRRLTWPGEPIGPSKLGPYFNSL
jgi:hypothetical protein